MPPHLKAWVVPSLAAVVLIVASGVGFAAFVKQATVQGTADRASFGLLVTEIGIVTGPVGILLQTTPLPAMIASVWINNTGPGAKVNLSVIVENIGTVPASNVVSGIATNTIGFNPHCTFGTGMSAAALNVPPGGVLNPGESFTTYWTFQAGPNLSSCQDTPFFQFTIAFNANAGT